MAGSSVRGPARARPLTPPRRTNWPARSSEGARFFPNFRTSGISLFSIPSVGGTAPAAVQDAGTRSEGDLDPRPGLQPDPHCHGAGGVPRGMPPRSIRFKATLQVLEAFRPLIAYHANRGADHRVALYEQLIGAVPVHRVADHPDRFEPRMARRRPKRYHRLTRPRREIKPRMLKRFTKFQVPCVDQTEVAGPTPGRLGPAVATAVEREGARIASRSLSQCDRLRPAIRRWNICFDDHCARRRAGARHARASRPIHRPFSSRSSPL